MSPLEALAADQRAVLQLVLKQGRSYDDLAGLLRIDRDAVRDRACAGLDALGPEAGRRLSPQRRREIADYLLGQQGTGEREATVDLLSASAGARAWARVVSGELAPLAREPLPAVPPDGPELESPLVEHETPVTPLGDAQVADAPVAEKTPAPAELEPSPPPPASDEAPAPPPPAAPAADEPEPHTGAAPADAPQAQPPAAERQPGEADGDLIADAAVPPGSQLGGLLLLGGLGILVVVAVIVLVSGGSSDSLSPTASSPTTAATAPAPGQTTPGSGAQAVPRQQINFTATAAGGNASGNAILFNQDRQNRMLVQARSLPPNASGAFYAVWVYAAPGQARVLGFQRVGSNGRFSAVAPAPANVTSFAQVLITREKPTQSNQAPTSPGPVFLQGSIKKG